MSFSSDAWESDDDDQDDAPCLSVLEYAVLIGLTEGLQSKEIASRINRSSATVEFYVRSLYLKLAARSRAQIVARAFSIGVLVASKSDETQTQY